jgi:tRNA-2-methylthio-N6-dimethylallyladenosine synthase
MNKHDSERVAGLLQSAGLREARDPDDADVIVFMTCCVRENADGRLIGQVASLKPYKTGRPSGLIAVGGCIGQRDGEILLRELPHVDVVFGTHNIGRLPALLQSAAESLTPVVEVLDAGEDFSSDLPTRRERRFHAWAPITVGCDNFCTYCIVPHVRGRERSRPSSQIVTEIEDLVADGVLEVTLLGQNVNSYGRDLHGAPSFAPLLRDVARTGIKRIRFATSHPKDLSDETISVMAEEPAVCRSLHLPVQSGSDRVLEAMNRRYTAESYLGTIEKLYAAMPELALSTDIIVGFPGETEADFEATLDVVRAARYDQAFTFIYSPREGTPAATMPDHVPREVSQVRFDRLVEIVHASAQAKNTALLGTVQRVLIEGPSRRDPSVLTGRSEGNKVVHVPVPAGDSAKSWAGRIVDIVIEDAQTWFLGGRLLG